MSTLEHLLDLDLSVMVEGHGHVHTLRRDIPSIPGVVVRTDPRSAIERKLEFLSWLDTQIAEAKAEGRSENATVAACFPWSRTWSWRRLAADEIARITTRGEFSRHQLIRSFTTPRSQPPDHPPHPARGPQLPAAGADYQNQGRDHHQVAHSKPPRENSVVRSIFLLVTEARPPGNSC